MEDIIVPVAVVGMLFIGLPGLILHYLTKWKSQTGISSQDEALLDELHDLARRLDQRIETVERIIAADNPNWKDGRISDQSEQRRLLR
ncbi:envelope stress response membrane protein PspB [Sandarakinorhabdus sp.]|uniref:envelope stress response membrane protein PspB n=1 Tax=Sandarakinorhabdus sp. TaxID=1916663 RepID=UPI00286E6CD3|nr:envelope stress response membrane protein PspB [Sandarakinorhabdus sp.]